MKLKWKILAIIYVAEFLVTIYLLHLFGYLDPTQVVNILVVGLVVGIVVAIVTVKLKLREQERIKRREKLKNNIYEHNQKLILEIKNWIRNGSASVYYQLLAKKHLEEYGDIQELYKEFDKGFRDIISDFEERRIPLKGTCKECKDWQEELKSLE